MSRFELKGRVIVCPDSSTVESSFYNLEAVKQLVRMSSIEDLELDEDEDAYNYNYNSRDVYCVSYLNQEGAVSRFIFDQDEFSEEDLEEFYSLVKKFLEKKHKKKIFEDVLKNSPFLTPGEAWFKTNQIIELYEKEGLSDLI